MIYNSRIQKFMQKTILKKRQRDVVQYFMRYVIEDNEIKKKDIARRQSTANQLVEGFEPTQDIYDRRILFEIAKRRVEAEDYHEDTSFEDDHLFGEEENISLSNLFGQNRNEQMRPSRVDALLNPDDFDDHGHDHVMSIPPPRKEDNIVNIQSSSSSSDEDV